MKVSPLTIAWRLLWIVPIYLVRYLFIILMFFAYGPDTAKEAAENTR